jgi:hypothetical protein
MGAIRLLVLLGLLASHGCAVVAVGAVATAAGILNLTTDNLPKKS